MNEAYHKDFPPGTEVGVISNPGEKGVVARKPTVTRSGNVLVPVVFPNGPKYVEDVNLEQAADCPSHPLEQMKSEILMGAKELRRALAHIRLGGKLSDFIYSLEITETEYYSHQFKPVIKILESPTSGLLIADEVGLGKTIEAGLIWTELRSRFAMNKLLVLCQKILCEKWRLELRNKMGVQARICKTPEIVQLINDGYIQGQGFAAICGIEELRLKKNTEILSECLESLDRQAIDMLVIDEAHHLKNPETRTNKLAHVLVESSNYKALLSATPISTSSRNLHSLLKLLDPSNFAIPRYFDDILDANAPLVEARELIRRGRTEDRQEVAENVSKLLHEASEKPLLKGSRQVAQLIDQVSKTDFGDLEERISFAARLEKVNLMSHVFTRTRKSDVVERRVMREPRSEFMDMSENERDFYEKVTKAIASYAQEKNVSHGFLLNMPQRQMASCMPAAIRHWGRSDLSTQDDRDTMLDDGIVEDGQQSDTLTGRLFAGIRELPSYEKLKENDSKYERLREVIRKCLKKPEPDARKVIVFSYFRGTLDYLQERLEADGVSTITLMGGGSTPKEEIIEQFASKEGPQVLLSSEAGSQGIDLQFCWVIVNYDLPWNPMQIEQRIGRIDRIGQKAKKLLIWNLVFNDTLDERIYRGLLDRLGVFRGAIGDLDEILGPIGKLADELMTQNLTPAQEEEKIRQTEKAITEKRRLEDEVSDSDLVLQKIKDAKKRGRRVDGRDIENYVFDFLSESESYQGFSNEPVADNECILELSAQAKIDLEKFISLKRNFSGHTKLHLEARRCLFSNKVRASVSPNTEIISQFHPLVRFIGEKLDERDARIRPAVGARLKRGNMKIDPGIYLLAVSHWWIEGITRVEQLAYEAVGYDGQKHLDPADAETLAGNCADRGELWHECPSECDISQAVQVFNDDLFARIAERHKEFIASEEARNHDRAAIQLNTLDRHFERKQEEIKKMIALLEDRAKTEAKIRNLINARKAQLARLEKSTEEGKLRIEAARNLKHDSEPQDICAAIILVE